MQVSLKDSTVERIEAVTGKNINRGADRMINEVLNVAEGLEPDDNNPRVVMCAGMKEAITSAKE